MALGQNDFGLYGLVGGLTAFISFFNGVLAGANARFYAFSVGAAKAAKDKSAALEECRRWFNTALSVHTIVPFILVAIGYPIGIYAVYNWLTIPVDRLGACVWVFRFVCLSCFIGMVNVPFSAMYTAKQYIAELTIYSVVTSTLNVLMMYYMVTHPNDWLVRYAAWMCFISIMPQIVICIRAVIIFPECKINLSYMWDRARLKRLGSFSGWQMLGVLCGMLRGQGMTIVVNKFFGAAMNAAQSIGNTVLGHCNSLASATHGAFVPVITQSCGAGDFHRMNDFVIRTCKFNVILSAIFLVPLALELPEVMRLWLKTPPVFTVGLCYCAMAFYFVDACTVGHSVAVNAVGKIAKYQVVVNLVSILTLPLAIISGLLYRNVYLVMGMAIFVAGMVSIVRLYFARTLAGTSIRRWVKEVFLMPSVAVLIGLVVGYLPHVIVDASFLRVCMTALFVEIIFLPIVWFIVLTTSERAFVKEKAGKIFRHFGFR